MQFTDEEIKKQELLTKQLGDAVYDLSKDFDKYQRDLNIARDSHRNAESWLKEMKRLK
jgi:hypothetical protein